MKRIICIILMMAAFYVGGKAQTSSTIEWKGIDPSVAVSSSNDKDKMVYFYNVGKNKWLGRGGNWGVEAVLSDVGIPFEISYNTQWSCYYFQSLLNTSKENGYLCPTSRLSGTEAETYKLYFLAGHHEKYGFNLTKSETTDETLQYQISYNDGKFYMVGLNIDGTTSGANTNSRICIYSKDQLTEVTEGEDKWILVPQSEREQKLIDLASQAKASNEDVQQEPCTYLVKDNDFARNATDVGNWKDADGNSLANGGAKETPTSSTTTEYYIGNGLDINNAQQKEYGGMWTANIHGASGKIYQTIDNIATTGKYRVRAHIFTTAELATSETTETASTSEIKTTTPDLVVKLFATAGDKESAQTSIAQVDRPTTEGDDGTTYPSAYIAAEKLLEDSQYEFFTEIVVGENSDNTGVLPLTIGVEVSGGNEKTWTCIDNIQLEYLGGFTNKVILNEDYENVDYLNTQNTDDAKSGLSAIFIHRTLNAGQWNSIVLPFSVSVTTIKNIFGDKTLVAKLKGAQEATPYTIDFENVTTGIEAGKLYLIKPEILNPYTVAEGGTITSSADETIYLNGNTEYYFINGNYSSTETFVEDITGDTGTEVYGTNGLVTFKGTYTLRRNVIPVHSYYLRSDGKWYYNTTNTSHSKGFRGWLATSTKSESEAKKFVVAINGVISMDETTGIDGIHTVEGGSFHHVYDLTGKLVAKNAKTLDGLSKGIYIVDGKKRVVK